VTNRVYTQVDMDGLRAMVQRDAESFKIKLPLAGREPEDGVQLIRKLPRALCNQAGKQMEREVVSD